MNPTVDAAVVVLFLLVLTGTSTSSASEDRYEQALMLNNAVIGEVRVMENKKNVQEATLTDEEILEMYPELNKSAPKEPPMSIMSGKISDRLIKAMADYLFGLLDGTRDVIKPTTSSPSTSPPPELLPFRPINTFFDDLAVIRDAPKVAGSSNFVEIRRNYPQRHGVSKKKSEKLWRKTRMVMTSGKV